MSQVVSWWKYNPIIQKPTTLDPVKPWAWYWYYGPDPASGCSYGQYHDDTHDFDMVTAKKKIVYSPASGKPMTFISDVSYDEIQDKMSKSTGGLHSKAVCAECQNDLVSDYDLRSLATFYCCACGNEVSSDCVTTANLIREKKTMRKERLDALKRKVKANIVRQNKEDDFAKARRKLREDRRKVKAEEEKAAEDDELISLDTVMEAVDEEQRKAEECESCEAEGDDDLISLDTIMEAMEEEEEEVVVSEEDEFLDEASEEGEEILEDKKEEGDDEYLDLDMVLSMINRKKRMQRKVKAEDEVKVEEKVEVKEEKKPEVKVEVKEEKKPEEAKEGDKEPNLLSEENPIPASTESIPAADMEAMKFEPLASFESLASVNKEQIDMTLYNEDSENPVWNVTVAGVPTAKIQLKNQMHSEEIRAVFCSDDYAKDLMVHCEKTGFVQTMNKVKADFWSNFTSNKKVAERFQKEAAASFGLERKRLLATFKQDFRTCMNIVSAGMSKNFYPDMGNPIKEHLFTNLRTVGLPEQTAISVVEKSFAEGAAPYFDALFEKSEEYMNLTSDARKEIAAAISHGKALEHTSDFAIEDAAPATLNERLAQASAVAKLSTSGLRVDQELVLDTNDYKSQLKSAWRR